MTRSLIVLGCELPLGSGVKCNVVTTRRCSDCRRRICRSHSALLADQLTLASQCKECAAPRPIPRQVPRNRGWFRRRS
ncbi:hypothetical protein AB0J83_42820 [Actinoplanes sp. NPDC049596]|uniref:hypothetical protein n=1 Tax=unclassified Actinoplanes TaxID=2626549 RepID=UPI0034198FCD